MPRETAGAAVASIYRFRYLPFAGKWPFVIAHLSSLYLFNLIEVPAMHRVLSFVLAVGLMASTTQASAGDRPTVTVSAIAHSEEGFTQMQQLALDVFNEAIRENGLHRPGARSVMLFVDAIPAGDVATDRIVLSVTMLSELPAEVISLAGETEAFYLSGALAERDLPAEGAHVRRAMSEDWIREYRIIDSHRLLVIDQADLQETAAAIVAAL